MPLGRALIFSSAEAQNTLAFHGGKAEFWHSTKGIAGYLDLEGQRSGCDIWAGYGNGMISVVVRTVAQVPVQCICETNQDLLLDEEEVPDPVEALELEDVPDPEGEADPEDPVEDVEGADVDVVELDPLSELVELVLLSVLDSDVLVSAGFPLFSDLLSGSLSLSE